MKSFAAIALALLLAGCAGNSPRPQTRTIASQPCWVIRTSNMELAITRLGGHMAPVTFYRDGDAPIRPYYISPWQDEKPSLAVPVEIPLRGDFFCMPFGGNAEPFNGERHTPHGEPAATHWKFLALDRADGITTLSLGMKTTVRPGTITKKLTLIDGQNVVYAQHTLEGFSGPMPLGHHATLATPQKEGALLLSTSPFQFGMTCPVLFSDPAQRAYQSFAIGQRFTDLSRVPLLWKQPAEADCTRFPARYGFTDLLAIFKKGPAPAWLTAVNTEENYLWFSLKDPALQPATVFWIENHGRHGAPWSGRNSCLGLEDVAAYFAEGIAPSCKPNEITVAGIPTAIELSPNKPTVVNYIEGVVKVPAGFDAVKSVDFGPASLIFTSASGKKVIATVRHEFVKTGRL